MAQVFFSPQPGAEVLLPCQGKIELEKKHGTKFPHAGARASCMSYAFI